MLSGFRSRVTGSGNGVSREEFNNLVDHMTQGDKTIAKPTKEMLEEDQVVAATMVRIYLRFRENVKKAKGTKRGRGMNEDSTEFAEYAYATFIEGIAADAKHIVSNGWYTLAQISSEERRFLDKIINGQNATISDLSADDEEEGITAAKEEPSSGTPFFSGNDLESLDTSQLILTLAEGLQYDRFDADAVRNELFHNRNDFTVNTMVVMCSAYIFVGNNVSKLGKSVKQVEIGNQVAQVLNKFDVKSKKLNQKTVTLARVGIIFSPVVWALRNIMKSSNRLQSSGVLTTTPIELQDVSLSGVSGKITGGHQIEDFLFGFNKVLTKYKEKGSKDKASDAEIKEESDKWWELARIGMQNDPIVSNWDFNSVDSKGELGIHEFYNQCYRRYASFQ